MFFPRGFMKTELGVKADRFVVENQEHSDDASVEEALIALRNPNILAKCDTTSRSMLVDLVSGGDWQASRERLVKKLEVIAIVAALISSCCLAAVFTNLEPNPHLAYTNPHIFENIGLGVKYFPSSSGVMVFFMHVYYASAILGTLLCLVCVIQAVLLQSHLLMFTPTAKVYVLFLESWKFDVVPMTMIAGLYCIVTTIPCAVFVVANSYFGVVTLILCAYFAISLRNLREHMVEHNSKQLNEYLDTVLEQYTKHNDKQEKRKGKGKDNGEDKSKSEPGAEESSEVDATTVTTKSRSRQRARSTSRRSSNK